MNRFALALALSVALTACDAAGLGVSNPNFLIIGHRGSPNLACENTMASFSVAAAVGANAIETDITVTSDGEFVIWHDRDPDDTIAVARQNGAEDLLCVPKVPATGSSWRRPVRRLSLVELRAHYGYGPLDGPRDSSAWIPRLSDLLDWLAATDGVTAIYLDLKFTGAELADAIRVLHMVTESGEYAVPEPRLGHVTFYLLSVQADVVRGLRDEISLTGTSTARAVWDYEAEGALAGTRSLGLRDVSIGLTPARSWSGYKHEIADLVTAREAGEVDSVTVWTFDREMQLAELLYYSVDGVMTNEPATLHRLWLSSLE
jgi:glycerophosphoryl diester phosphodiesterase